MWRTFSTQIVAEHLELKTASAKLLYTSQYHAKKMFLNKMVI